MCDNPRLASRYLQHTNSDLRLDKTTLVVHPTLENCSLIDSAENVCCNLLLIEQLKIERAFLIERTVLMRSLAAW